jgi:hypothetical protein
MPTNAGAETQLQALQLRNRNATWPARATARRNAVPETACLWFRTTAGSRHSLQRRTLARGIWLAATPTQRRSVAFLTLFRSLPMAATLMLRSPTVCKLARREVSHTVAPSTTRSATAATALLQPVWRLAQIHWPPAATILVRVTAVRAVAALVASLCTPPIWLRKVARD